MKWFVVLLLGMVCVIDAVQFTLDQGVVAEFIDEGGRGVLSFSGLQSGKEYTVGFDSQKMRSSLSAEKDGRLELMIYRHDKKAKTETIILEGENLKGEIVLNW